MINNTMMSQSVQGLEYTPFSFSDDPHEYNQARQIESDILISSYGAVGIDEELVGLDYFCEIISQVTRYHNLQHIGFSEDSVVFQTNWLDGLFVQTGVLKCIFDFTCSYDSVVYDYLSQGKSIEQLGYLEASEISLLKHAFLERKDHWCEPLDMFYFLEIRKTYVKRWLCVALPLYQHTFYSIPMDSLTIRQKKKMVLQLSRAVYSLHKIGYYHGDLKPKNICIDSSEYVRLIDFGTSNKISNVSSLNWLKNTYGYFSPIQCFNHLVQESIPNIVSQLPKRLLEELRRVLKKKGISICIYVTPQMDSPIEYIPEHGFSNDLFVIGILMSFLFDTTYQHLFLKRNKENQHIDEYLELMIHNIILFVKNPKVYLKDYYNQVSFPLFLREVFEFCIGQWNVQSNKVTIENTSQKLEQMMSVL
jgi:Protein kinase domain